MIDYQLLLGRRAVLQLLPDTTVQGRQPKAEVVECPYWHADQAHQDCLSRVSLADFDQHHQTGSDGQRHFLKGVNEDDAKHE